MPLHFNVDISAAEDVRELLNNLAPCLFAAAHQRCGQRALVAARQAHEAGCVLLKIVEVRRALLLGGLAHLELRDQLAEILVALARFAQQGHACRFRRALVRQPCRRFQPLAKALDRNFRADMRANAAALAAGMKPRRTVHAVAIGNGHGRHLQLGRALNQRLRLRACFKKTEGAGRVQLDVALSHTAPPSASRRASGRGPRATAEQGTVAGSRHNVPLLVAPQCRLPPVATGEPWAVGAVDIEALPAKIEPHRPLRFERDG